MKLPLPRSRRARLVAGVVVLAAAGGVGGVAVLGGGDAPAAAAAAPAAPAHPAWLLTVDPAGLPEAPVPADAPVVHPEGEGGLLSLEQLAALDGASVERDREGRLRVTHGDWRASATELDAVRGLPGVVTAEAAEAAGEHAFLVTTDLAPDQLAGLPGVVAVAAEDGTPVPAAPVEAGTAAEPAADPAAEESGH